MSRDILSRWFSSDDLLVRMVRNSSWLFSAEGVDPVPSIFYLAILTGIILFVLSQSLISNPQQRAPKSRQP
ncbi:MAG: hypothetical protein V7679_01160 [Parasphingorhabdus sp.]